MYILSDPNVSVVFALVVIPVQLLQPFSNIIFSSFDMKLSVHLTRCLFGCFYFFLTTCSKIFHLCEDVISIGEGLQDLGKAGHL